MLDTDAIETDGKPLWITFFVALPSVCPLPHGTVISRTFEEELIGLDGIEVRATESSEALSSEQISKIFVSLKFWQLKESLNSTDSLHGMLQVINEVTGKGEVPEEIEAEYVDTYRTVVEMVTAQNASDLKNANKALSEAFDRCFGVLSQVFSMSRLVRRHEGSLHLGSEQSSYATWFGRLPGEAYGDLGGVLWIAPPPHIPSVTFDTDEFSRLEAHLGRLWNGSPLELVMDRAAEAHQLLRQQGDYANAVIHSAMSSEILLDSLLGLMLWEEQIGSEDFNKAVGVFDEAKGGGLTSRIKREYAPRLAGNWNPAVSGPVRQWSEDLAYLRGRVVHRGYRPAKAEAVAALEASDNLLEFVKSRLALKSRIYPRTSLMILGEPGLRRIGGWKAVSNFLGSSDEHPLSWFSSYSQWRNMVDSMRVR